MMAMNSLPPGTWRRIATSRACSSCPQGVWNAGGTGGVGAAVKIGIIGAGQIGGTLTRKLAALGHDVYVANSRSPETLKDLAQETGATAGWAADAATGAHLVIVSIPQKNVVDLASGIVG